MATVPPCTATSTHRSSRRTAATWPPTRAAGACRGVAEDLRDHLGRSGVGDDDLRAAPTWASPRARRTSASTAASALPLQPGRVPDPVRDGGLPRRPSPTSSWRGWTGMRLGASPASGLRASRRRSVRGGQLLPGVLPGRPALLPLEPRPPRRRGANASTSGRRSGPRGWRGPSCSLPVPREAADAIGELWRQTCAPPLTPFRPQEAAWAFLTGAGAMPPAGRRAARCPPPMRARLAAGRLRPEIAGFRLLRVGQLFRAAWRQS